MYIYVASSLIRLYPVDAESMPPLARLALCVCLKPPAHYFGPQEYELTVNAWADSLLLLINQSTVPLAEAAAAAR